MSEISIQVRRVTEKVKQYYTIFGLRPHGRMTANRSVIKGSKRLGFDEIECVVAETARGTSVGFYAINQLQGLLHSIPFLILLLFAGLGEIPTLKPFIEGTGENSIKVDWIRLIGGDVTFGFSFTMIILSLASIFAMSEIIIQRIRLDIIKSRFSFYSRDALWETRDIPQSIIGLQALRSVFSHVWMLAVIYFAVFSSKSEILKQLSIVYNSSEEELYSATTDAFVITGGLVFGLLLAYKSLLLRRQYARVDDRNRISGGLTERRIDPIIFGIQSAVMGGGVFMIFLVNTFLISATASQLGVFMLFVIIGAFIAGAIYSEGDAWVLASYAVFIFFTSLILIFKTGSQPAYAYIVVLQLFFLPLPFVVLLSNSFSKVLTKNDIRTKDWYFDILPLTSFITLYLNKRKKEATKKAYEESLAEGVPIDDLDYTIRINKEILNDHNSNAYRAVRHYFELLFTYTASFEETQFITLPTINQLDNWWVSKTGSGLDTEETKFIVIADQLLWDPKYNPDDQSLGTNEATGKKMVLEIQ